MRKIGHQQTAITNSPNQSLNKSSVSIIYTPTLIPKVQEVVNHPYQERGALKIYTILLIYF